MATNSFVKTDVLYVKLDLQNRNASDMEHDMGCVFLEIKMET